MLNHSAFRRPVRIVSTSAEVQSQRGHRGPPPRSVGAVGRTHSPGRWPGRPKKKEQYPPAPFSFDDRSGLPQLDERAQPRIIGELQHLAIAEVQTKKLTSPTGFVLISSLLDGYFAGYARSFSSSKSAMTLSAILKQDLTRVRHGFAMTSPFPSFASNLILLFPQHPLAAS